LSARSGIVLVGEFMSHRIEGIDAEESVRRAAERMRALEVGLLVVFQGGRIVGIVTDRDLVVRALAAGLEPSAPVRLAMSGGVVTCFADEDVRAAATIMARDHIRRLLVLDRDLAPIGILSLDDLALRGCDPEIVVDIFAQAAP
jgi:CBS domain-containing protein